MTPKQFQIHINDLSKEVQQFMNVDGPAIAANIAVEKFKENFEKEGFFGEKWKEVQRRQPGTKAYKSVSKKHPVRNIDKILHKTSNLRDSINFRTEPGRAIVYSDTTYGRYHNEGDGKIPKRQFMGKNAQLEKEICDKLNQKLQQIFKK